MSEAEYQDTRKMSKDAPFHLDPNYYTSQLEAEVAIAHRELRMQKAGFEQLQDLYNNRIDELASMESELEKVRGGISEHEAFAVEQQLKIDSHTTLAKDLGFDTFEALAAEYYKTLGKPQAQKRGNQAKAIVDAMHKDEPKE